MSGGGGSSVSLGSNVVIKKGCLEDVRPPEAASVSGSVARPCFTLSLTPRIVRSSVPGRSVSIYI